MDIFMIFSLLGGLAFFLYGINLMSSGLEKVAGGKLEQMLKKMTSNPAKSFILGADFYYYVHSNVALGAGINNIFDSKAVKNAMMCWWSHSARHTFLSCASII